MLRLGIIKWVCCRRQEDFSFQISATEGRATRRSVNGDIWNGQWKVTKVLATRRGDATKAPVVFLH